MGRGGLSSPFRALMNKGMSDDIIHVLGGRLSLRQAAEGFKSSIDAVLLAAACPVKPAQSVLDMGCGVGTAGLCVLARANDTQLCGMDVQDDHVTLARENAARNALDERAEFVTSDIRDFRGQSYDHVICNPPYLREGDHVKSPSQAKALAMGADVTLEDWVRCAFDHIKGQGSLTFIHRADQVDRIVQALGKRFGGVEIIPLWPRAGVAAKRVVVRSYKHKKSPAALHPGLVLHVEHKDDYTPETEKILREAAPLL